MEQSIERQVQQLEEEMRRVSRADRLQMYPRVRRIVDNMAGLGQSVPRRLCEMKARLEDEEFEDRFDNMPI